MVAMAGGGVDVHGLVLVVQEGFEGFDFFEVLVLVVWVVVFVV